MTEPEAPSAPVTQVEGPGRTGGGASVQRQVGAGPQPDPRARPGTVAAGLAAANAAIGRGDADAALAVWAALRDAVPGDPAAYLRAAGLLERTGRDPAAEAILGDGVGRCPDDMALALGHARTALRRGDLDAALHRWTRACERFAADDAILSATTNALLAQGRRGEAERLLAQTAQRFPDADGPLVTHAWIAHRDRDWPAASLRWEAVQARFPDVVAGPVNGAIALRALGRFEAAEALLRAAVGRFPDDPWPASEYAALANHREQWAEAIARWARFRDRFPDEPAGFVGSCWALREHRAIGPAAAMVQVGLDRFPDHPDLLREHAWVAEQQRDWPLAASRWRRARTQAPDDPGGYQREAAMVRRLGRPAEADAVLNEGLRRFPDDPGLLAGGAEAATSRGDHAEALRRRHAVRRRFPLHRQLQNHLYAARLRMVESDPAAAEAAAETGDVPAGVATPADRRMYDTMMAFESLGGALLGCEFGGVQRAFGAEPLGLLRWADVAPDHLGAALEQRFEGVGAPEHTELSVADWEPPEYVTRDTRFHMAMHSFVPAAEVPAETMLAGACARLRYLRRKLIEDLGGGAKIFVYKVTFRDLTDAELGRIHRPLRRYGDNTLLYVRYADQAHLDGTVAAAAPGLLVGYLDHFGVSRDGTPLPLPLPLPLPVESWAMVCRRAYALWCERR